MNCNTTHYRANSSSVPGDPTDLALQLSGRTTLPSDGFDGGVYAVGRAGGKTQVAMLILIYLAVCRSYPSLAKGEIGRVLCLAPTTDQARILVDRIVGTMEAHPLLAGMIASKTTYSITLTNGIQIEVVTASYRYVRGFAVCAVVIDEAAFLPEEQSADRSDVELWAALEPALIRVKGNFRLLISSPFGPSGLFYKLLTANHCDGGDMLAIKAPSLVMNPTLPASVVEKALKEDPQRAAAEYLAEFRNFGAGMFTLDQLLARTLTGIAELSAADARTLDPKHFLGFEAFADFATGSGLDSAALSIAARFSGGDEHAMTLVCLREVQPPFSPSRVAKEFAEVCKSYGVRSLKADRVGRGWVDADLRAHGVRYEESELSKSDLFISLLSAVNSDKVVFLDDERLRQQLLGLQRRKSRAGVREIVTHGRHGDDVANAAAGALAGVFNVPAQIRVRRMRP